MLFFGQLISRVGSWRAYNIELEVDKKSNACDKDMLVKLRGLANKDMNMKDKEWSIKLKVLFFYHILIRFFNFILLILFGLVSFRYAWFYI